MLTYCVCRAESQTVFEDFWFSLKNITQSSGKKVFYRMKSRKTQWHRKSQMNFQFHIWNYFWWNIQHRKKLFKREKPTWLVFESGRNNKSLTRFALISAVPDKEVIIVGGSTENSPSSSFNSLNELTCEIASYNEATGTTIGQVCDYVFGRGTYLRR